MLIVRRIEEIKQLIREKKKVGLKIGFVPTMGYLHDGHLELMRQAKRECDFVAVSIFVNPIQFGEGEDYDTYPRDLSRDTELAGSAGADVIFAPSVTEMYPRGYASFVEVNNLTEKLCGLARPGHFRGVTTVVTKLFNVVEPDIAYFGKKDAQQVLIIKKMVQDLNMNLKIATVPTVRESDGLAMSSRNSYLSPAERKAAPVLYKSLKLAQELIESGEKDTEKVLNVLNSVIKEEPLAEIDYVEVLRLPELVHMPVLDGEVLLALAVRFGTTRLIDNLMVEV